MGENSSSSHNKDIHINKQPIEHMLEDLVDISSSFCAKIPTLTEPCIGTITPLTLANVSRS